MKYLTHKIINNRFMKNTHALFLKYGFFLCLVVFFSSCKVNKVSKKDYSAANKIIESARNYTGVPYKIGGNDFKGIDCSGLLCNVFKENGVTLPRISWQQSEVFPAIRIEDVRKGDLVFFVTGGKFISHAGIITEIKSKEEIMFIHASSSKGVREDNLYTKYWWERLAKVTRSGF
jgi:probable lipoprotein NlpC